MNRARGSSTYSRRVWALGCGSVREVHRQMCPDGELAFNTVQTLLRIMEEKGLVRHRAAGRTFVYEPIYSRDRVTSRFLHRVFDGRSTRLSSASCRRRRPGAEELRGLERLIATARESKDTHHGATRMRD